MVLSGVEGPVAPADAQLGIVLNVAGKLMGAKLDSDEAKRRTHLYMKRPKPNRQQTDLNHPLGMDLSQDTTARVFDELGLPVRTGLSGTSADAVLQARYLATHFGDSWIAPDLTDEQAKMAMIDLNMVDQRTGATPEVVQEVINKTRAELGEPPLFVPESTVFTHSYAEIYAGVVVGIEGVRGDNEAVIRRAALEAKQKLDAYPPPPSAGSRMAR